MAKDTQDEPSRNSIVGRSVVSPPPPYTSIDLKNDRQKYHRRTVDDTVSKMQEVIESTYLMMQDFQNRLARLECSNQLFTTGLAPFILNNSANITRVESQSTDDNDYTDILDTMTHTVQQLLGEAQASLDRTVILPPTATATAIDSTETMPSIAFDQQSRYIASERRLDRAFELLMSQVCNTSFNYDGTRLMPATHLEEIDSPSSTSTHLGKGVDRDYHYHHHHHYYHHHHHYSDDHTSPYGSLPRKSAVNSAIVTSAMPIDHSDYVSTSSDITNTVLSTATTKSVQLVQSWLSPLHRFTSLSPPTNNHSTSPVTSLPLSPSASLSTSTTTSATLLPAQTRKHLHQQLYYTRFYRMMWVLLLTSRLILEQHYQPHSYFLRNNIHRLQPRQRYLWHKYKSILLGSPWPALCRQMCRFIYIIQFIYHIISL